MNRVDKTRAIENILSKVFDQLWSKIKTDDNYPSNLIQIQKDYNNLVYTAIRKAVENVYREGIDYVGQVTKTDTYLTDTDLAEIKKITVSGVTRFWRQIEAEGDREESNESMAFIGLEANPLFNTQYFLHSVATWITISSLSTATSSKARQILKPTTTPSSINPDLQVESQGDIPYALKWITKHDERVCPICQALSNKVFRPTSTNAYLIPLPPDNSHYKCRCYMELIISKTNKLALIPNRFKVNPRVRTI